MCYKKYLKQKKLFYIPHRGQELPLEPWKTWLILAGRGFGKTRAAAEGIIELIVKGKVKFVGLLAATILEGRLIMVEGLSGLINICINYKIAYKHLPSLHKIIINGVVCQYFGADCYEKLRGFQFDAIWMDELCKYKNPRGAFDGANLCLRLGETKMIISTTPKPIALLDYIIAMPNTHISRGNSLENNYLSQNFKLITKTLEETLYKQEIEGQIISNNLWTKADIQYESINKIERYFLGIDPAVGMGVTGLILVGYGENKYFVIDDFSSNATPDVWIEIVRTISSSYMLTIMVEINQGGNLLKTLINAYNINASIVECRAISSKMQRAQLLFLKYKQGLIKHTKPLAKLEYELLNQDKMDRIDALFWATSSLRNFSVQLI